MPNPNILTPREPFGDAEKGRDGKATGKVIVTRSWWRFLDNLTNLSGKLADPVTVAPNSIITPGTINSGSTLTIQDLPAGTILGNSTGAADQPAPQTVGPSLTFQNGVLDAGTLPPGTLAGNPTTADAPATAIQIDPNSLTLINGVLAATAGGGGAPDIDIGLPLVQTVAYWAGS